MAHSYISPDQGELFPVPEDRTTMDVDTWVRGVKAGTPGNPYMEQEARELRYAGLEPEPVIIERPYAQNTDETESSTTEVEPTDTPAADSSDEGYPNQYWPSIEARRFGKAAIETGRQERGYKKP